MGLASLSEGALGWNLLESSDWGRSTCQLLGVKVRESSASPYHFGVMGLGQHFEVSGVGFPMYSTIWRVILNMSPSKCSMPEAVALTTPLSTLPDIDRPSLSFVPFALFGFPLATSTELPLFVGDLSLDQSTAVS